MIWAAPWVRCWWVWIDEAIDVRWRADVGDAITAETGSEEIPDYGGRMPLRKAESVSLASVARAVDKAVKVAAARHELRVEDQTLIDRWEIIGRRLRDVADMNIAYRFASDVSGAVKIPGIRVEPIVTRIGRDTWVGFIERSRLPKALPR